MSQVRSEAAYLLTGAIALGLEGAVAAYVLLSTPAAGAPLAAIISGAAIVLFAGGLAMGRLDAVQWAVGLQAAVYVGTLLYRGAMPDPWGALIAVGLLLSSEMASWATDSRRRGRDDVAVHALRLRAVALVMAAALAMVVVVQTASRLGGAGTASAALATGAVLLAVGAVSLLMWRSRAS